MRTDKIAAPRRPSALRWGMGLSAAVPVISSMVPAATVLSAALLPMRAAAPWTRWVKSILWSAALAVVAMFIAGAYSPAGWYTTHILGVVVFALCLTGFSKVAGTVDDAAAMLAIAGAATVVYFVVVGWDGSRELEVIWKYGIAFPATAAILYITSRAHRLLPIIALGGLAVASLALEYRSFSGLCLAAIVAWVFHSRAGSSRYWWLRAGIVAGFLIGISTVLIAVIESGAFGESLRSKTEWQLSGGGPALLSGRVEPPLSLAAIVQNPVGGWGNPNAIRTDTLGLGAQFANSIGMYDLPSYYRMWVRADGRISLHSILFESWVTGGILAAIFPLALIALFVVTLFRASGRLYPLVALVCIQGVWDVLFSPWAENRAALLAASLLVAALALREANRRNDESGRAEDIVPARPLTRYASSRR